MFAELRNKYLRWRFHRRIAINNSHIDDLIPIAEAPERFYTERERDAVRVRIEELQQEIRAVRRKLAKLTNE